MSTPEQDNGHQKQTTGPSSDSASPGLPDGIENNSYFDSANASSPKKRRIPPWLDHFNAKDLKELAKCSIAVWIVTLFIVINPVLRTYGQAMFFGW
jgi:hypothetical protein